MAKTVSFESVKDEYKNLLDTLEVRSNWKSALNRWTIMIQSNKARYQAVSNKTGVPWEFIGVVHMMESGCNFSTHLHNGDPLTKRTTRVPRGYPKTGTPPFTWEESAEDALRLKNLHNVDEWTPERICYELERYNGFGYRLYHKDVLSPYLWSGTTHYRAGKYVSDGKWDKNHVSAQLGAVAVYKAVAVTTLTPKEVHNTSTGMQTGSRIKRFVEIIGGAFASFFTLETFGGVTSELAKVKNMVGDNAWWLTLLGLGAVWLYVQYNQAKTLNAYKEGRYIPSGAVETIPVKED